MSTSIVTTKSDCKQADASAGVGILPSLHFVIRPVARGLRTRLGTALNHDQSQFNMRNRRRRLPNTHNPYRHNRRLWLCY